MKAVKVFKVIRD